jgi:serine protease Do
VGWVNHYTGQQFLLHTTITRRGQEIDSMAFISNPPHMFVPTSGFEQSLKNPPKTGEPLALSWLGTPNMTGLNKDVAQVYGLEEQPTVEIGDVVPNSPADKAGLKVGMKITKLNGQPLERGDQPDELPGILERKIVRMPVGTKVNLTILTEKDQPTKDYAVTLEKRPKDNTQARRYWAEDLGFGVRELVWEDTYERKQPQDMKGLVVSVVKPNSAAASAKLAREDIITQFNNQTISDIDQFEKDYKAFRQEKPKEAIVLVVLKRDASTQTIRIEPPQ